MVQAAASCVAADASLDPPAGCAFGYFKPLHHSPRFPPPSSRARRAPRPRNSADRIPAPALGLSRGDRAAAGARRRAGGRRPPLCECTRQRDAGEGASAALGSLAHASGRNGQRGVNEIHLRG